MTCALEHLGRIVTIGKQFLGDKAVLRADFEIMNAIDHCSVSAQESELVRVEHKKLEAGISDIGTAYGEVCDIRRGHRCPVCWKTFVQSGTMNRHLKIHSGGSSFSCSLCGKTYNRKDNLSRHMRFYHQLIGDSLGESDLFPDS